MQKNILFSILLIVFTLGLHGCSCSQKSKNTLGLAPGLYLSQVSINEGNSGAKAAANFSVTLQRDNSDTVVVSYTVSAIDPTGRTAEEIADFAVVGDDDADPNTLVDIIATTGTITFAAGSDVAQASIELIGDTVYEHNEKFLITLSAASAGVDIMQGSVEAVIVNDDAMPVVSMVASTTSVAEVFSGIGLAENIPTTPLNNADLTFTLDKASRVDSSVVIFGQGAQLNGADFRIDYLLSQDDEVLYVNKPVVIPAGETSVVVSLKAVDDGIKEGDESFQLSLSTAVDTTFVTTNSAHRIDFTLTDNDIAAKASRVNDTGVLEELDILTAKQEAETDRNYGVDKTLLASAKVGAGRAGFDYTKFDVSGVEVGVDVVASYDVNSQLTVPWECVKDNVSGLLWEVKAGSGVRGEGHYYYWYDPNAATNGGDQGERGSSICLASPDGQLINACNTAYYVADVNDMKLCGMTGWRLPTIEELRTLVDYGVFPGTKVGQSPISYDTDYFSGDQVGVSFVWSSTTDAQSPSRAMSMRFQTPSFEESRPKGALGIGSIRLVNDSLLNTLPIAQ